MEVAKLIIDSIGEDCSFPMAMKLLQAVKELEAKKADKHGTLDMSQLDEVEKKIVALKDSEERRDLAWMNYSSWNCLSRPFQKVFTSLVEPLFWGGLYFELSKFEQHKEELLSLIGDGCISVLKYANGFEFFCTSFNDARTNNMGIAAFRDAKKDYEKRILRSYGWNGQVFCKVVREYV